MNSNMKAELIVSRRIILAEAVYAELVAWRVSKSIRGSVHSYKYRLALIAKRICVLRYDNESGKGDHRHLGDTELPYRFRGVDALLADFEADVRRWLDENRDT